jgi:glycosyltransferase involved in cell wall biosynthesis
LLLFKFMLSVIICTHNPRANYFARVLRSLQAQTLSFSKWELLIIDNASQQPISAECVDWHPQARVIREEQVGLTVARLRGFREATQELMVFVDDDNVLDANYLYHVVQIFQEHPEMGAIGGKSLPEFEISPPDWVAEFYNILALRDFGEASLTTAAFKSATPQEYPAFAPAGAGMALRRRAFACYVARVIHSPTRLALGRTGKQLISGEDNDIILTLMNTGWEVGYFPQLQLTHLIPTNRVQPEYLSRLNRASSCSWVKVLSIHGIHLWNKIPRWTVLPRKIRAFFRYRPWQDPAAYVRWCGVCGLFEGQSALQ